MDTGDIYNFLEVNDFLITAGQPTAEQLRAAAAEGIKTVINLAASEPPYTLAGEAELVQSLGMNYYHIPVDWNNPLESDFAAFEALMQRLSDPDNPEVPREKTLIHCVANFRVTAFYSLYALKHLGWSEEQSDRLRARIWQERDYPVWEQFIRRLKASGSQNDSKDM